MSLTELLPILRALPRADKLRVIQFLVGEIATEENIPPIEAEGSYPIWSPYNAFDAADTLLEALAEEDAADQ